MTSLSSAFLRTAGQAAFAAFALSALPDCGAPSPTPIPSDSGTRYIDSGTTTPPLTNRPPIASEGTYIFTEGVFQMEQLYGMDPEGHSLRFSPLGLSALRGATLSATTGVLTWRPNIGQAGHYTFNYFVTDLEGATSAIETIFINVEAARIPSLDAGMPPPVDSGIPPERDASLPPPVDSGVSCFRPPNNTVSFITSSVRICSGTYTNTRFNINGRSGIEMTAELTGPLNFMINDGNSTPAISIINSRDIALRLGGTYEWATAGRFTAVSITGSTSITLSGGRFINAGIRVYTTDNLTFSEASIDTPDRRACLLISGGRNYYIHHVSMQNCGGDTSLDEHALSITGAEVLFSYVNVTNTRNGIKIDGNGEVTFETARVLSNGNPLLADAVFLSSSDYTNIRDSFITDNTNAAVNLTGRRGQIFRNDFRRNVGGVGDPNCSQNICSGNTPAP